MADFQLDFSIGRVSFLPVHLSTTFIHISYSLWETAGSRTSTRNVLSAGVWFVPKMFFFSSLPLETHWHCSFTDPCPLHSHTPWKPFWDLEVRKGQILRFFLGESMIVLQKRLKTTGYCYFIMYQKDFHTKCRASVLFFFGKRSSVGCCLQQLWTQKVEFATAVTAETSQGGVGTKGV